MTSAGTPSRCGNAAAAQYSAAYRLMLALKMFPLVYGDSLSQPAAKLAHSDRAGLVAANGVLIPAYGPAGAAAAMLASTLLLAVAMTAPLASAACA